MKKTLKLLACLTLAFALSACDKEISETDYLGTWDTVDMIIDGQSYVDTAAALGLDTDDIPGVTIEIKEDGTVLMQDSTGINASVEGTWELSDNSITISAGGSTLELELTDNQLVGEVNSSKIFLEKQ